MKKTLIILAALLMTSTMLVSCKDGVCDTCKENDAFEVSKEEIARLKEEGLDEYIDVDKEWCEACFLKASLSAAKEVLGDAFSNLGEALKS